MTTAREDADRAALVAASRPPRPAAVPTRPAQPIAPKPVGNPSFQIVDEVPDTPGRGTSVPAERQALIDFALANPRKWIKYTPFTEKTKLHAIGSAARKAAGGFPEGFEAKMRNGELYVSYRGRGGQ